MTAAAAQLFSFNTSHLDAVLGGNRGALVLMLTINTA